MPGQAPQRSSYINNGTCQVECSHLEGCGSTVLLTVYLMGVIKDRLTVTSFTDYLPASGFVLKCLKTFKKERSINHKVGGGEDGEE